MDRRRFLSMLGLAPLAPAAVAVAPAITGAAPMAFLSTSSLLSPEALARIRRIMELESVGPVPMREFSKVYPMPRRICSVSHWTGRTCDSDLGIVEGGNAGDKDRHGVSAILPDDLQDTAVERLADDLGQGKDRASRDQESVTVIDLELVFDTPKVVPANGA
jgi:hypothetical protein